jgi:hypothetical protein
MRARVSGPEALRTRERTKIRTAPAVAGAVLMLVLLMVLEENSSPDIQLEAPEASTAPGFRCSHPILAEFNDLLPDLGKRPLDETEELCFSPLGLASILTHQVSVGS